MSGRPLGGEVLRRPVTPWGCGSIGASLPPLRSSPVPTLISAASGDAETQPLSRGRASVGSAAQGACRGPSPALPASRLGRGPSTACTAAPPDRRTGPQPAPEADGVMRHLPYFCRGEVVRGFGRGSKQLGIPTANFPEQVVDNLPADISTGIYYGWASVGSGDVHKMVVSIGWNPYYKNTKKSMETHIIHTFKEDFYGETLNVAIAGYLRPEKNFDSLESLISAIQGDIEEAKKRLDLPEHLKLKEDNFFQVSKSNIMNGH
ncbi:riboflavin kinase [Rhinolophus ferrumequinum]|nr:riboflavin kinase [Rhinolophus ferrumequinum]